MGSGELMADFEGELNIDAYQKLYIITSYTAASPTSSYYGEPNYTALTAIIKESTYTTGTNIIKFTGQLYPFTAGETRYNGKL